MSYKIKTPHTKFKTDNVAFAALYMKILADFNLDLLRQQEQQNNQINSSIWSFGINEISEQEVKKESKEKVSPKKVTKKVIKKK